MAKCEIPVKVYFGEIEEIIKELGQLQTYKLFEGAEEVLIETDEVVGVLSRHVKVIPAEPEQRWIPVSERLPEEYKYVLLCGEPEPDEDTGYSQMAVGWLEDGKICCWDDRVATKEFVAWMPLPEPYKEIENG